MAIFWVINGVAVLVWFLVGRRFVIDHCPPIVISRSKRPRLYWGLMVLLLLAFVYFSWSLLREAF